MEVSDFLRHISLMRDNVYSTLFGLEINRAKLRYIQENWSSLVRALERTDRISLELQLDFQTPIGRVTGSFMSHVSIREGMPPEEGLMEVLERTKRIINMDEDFLRRTYMKDYI
ncbi:hypothetical protein [Sulfuracidifex tepidarius]|uniref:Uncharacterized protein n=1 Tax=Sulfuracidifex tepidarius TaxID=1294262 RepID=A0A510DZS8_9CREN|nr:hypothetical protein [Sulfuracidifex tepidarius]BBG25687.1 hypothetical protein IC007_0192 [Sulfuracidifex tepidarius]